jgi:protein-S-isoprenylcysteine O-methyltransferase Ste14
LATTGPYKYVRHPQYVGFIAIMFGFLVQWPTLVTLVMFPILVTVYIRLAKREEQEVRAEFGMQWDEYAARTPGFFPWHPRGSRPVGRERDVHA